MVRLRASVALCSFGALLSSGGSIASALQPPTPPPHSWRQQIHPFPATTASQDASGVVYTEADGRWHVMPDCSGGYAPTQGLSWCHMSSERTHPVPSRAPAPSQRGCCLSQAPTSCTGRSIQRC